MKTTKAPAVWLCGLLAVVILACACAPAAKAGAGQQPPGRSPVACKELETLRALREHMVVSSNARTGHSLEYVVIGDGARSDALVLMFNGTGGVFPDWPIQMLTNGAASPRIVRTGLYDAKEESPASLCHDHRLVLFDYPGVGDGRVTGAASFDQLADDVDAMLADISAQYRVPTERVSLVGWSLGTLVALKYALLSPAVRPERRVQDLVLIASKPGGSVSGHADGHGAPCITTFFEQLKSPALGERLSLGMKSDLFRLLYPYEHQQPYDGQDSGCTAAVDVAAHKATLSIEPHACGLGTPCGKNLEDYLLNRLTPPWSHTSGVSQALYLQQREVVHDWNECYCAAAGTGFTSARCSCSEPPQLSETNGGVCQTRADDTALNAPVASNCAPLKFEGRLTVIAGREDLFIQWTYGKALVEAYQAALGKEKASLVLYGGPDGAGHGVLVQHPRWVQEQLRAALEHP